MTSRRPLLTVDDLAVSFSNGPGPCVRAVDGVQMTIYPRQTLAVVGESGCGKSVTALTTLGLVPSPPGRTDRGRILFEKSDGSEVDLLQLDQRALRQLRGGEIAMIFQEPMTSLNPVFSVGEQIIEAVVTHRHCDRKGARKAAIEAMHDVGIAKPADRLRAYPHQFSGGMRQRVMIAMALACRPRLLLADEPTTALDVTIQAQILDLLGELQRSRGLAVMLITHDLGIVGERAQVACVMYAGRVVEYARVGRLFAEPKHPYTRGLLACIPRIGHRQERLRTIRQVIDDPAQFAPLATAVGPVRPWWPEHQPPPEAQNPVLVETEPEHWVAVWADTLPSQRRPDIVPETVSPA
ncbi:MAG: ABC transporter ATP-binding protein [Leptolyngbya sp. PLA3]|nr:MAG: ABC transporter ATP-binding protein [Cyanobacteria bacterium CYA]MCE7968123.1 ABC transporter ATP-binding protein [Leptolyngbya sp. PL-A3]